MPNPLTDREKEVLLLSSQGKTADVIGQLLDIKERTVIFHRESIYEKLGVSTIVQACCKAVREGYIPAILLVVGIVSVAGMQEPELSSIVETNIKPTANVCIISDTQEPVDDLCVADGEPISSVPSCKEIK